MIIAVDFDGTIVEHKYPEIGDPLPMANHALRMIHSWGHKIIIWTCRYRKKDLEKMKEFLMKYNIPYDKINENVIKEFSPHPKIYADMYIDDRSFELMAANKPVDWVYIMKVIYNMTVTSEAEAHLKEVSCTL